jgi:hypothetical protein
MYEASVLIWHGEVEEQVQMQLFRKGQAAQRRAPTGGALADLEGGAIASSCVVFLEH